MFETGLHELEPDGQFNITGRGLVYTFERGNVPESVKDVRDFLGMNVMIKGQRYKVTGVETAGYAKQGPYGLLVRKHDYVEQ